MKYIRTKDGIKAYNECCDISYVYQCIGGIKVANTIEELCDTFVICVDKQGYLIIDDYKKAMEIMQRNDDYNAICYGAIWCDWGLKYVAKMNEKGELELL